MAQNNQSQRNEFFKEVCKLLKDFVRRDFIKDKILEQPKELKKIARKLNSATLIMNCIFALFSYLTLAGNYAIEHGLGILGIALYMVYAAQSIVHIFYNQWNQNISTEFEFVKEDSLTMIGSKILAKVSWNVYQQEGNKWKQATNEEITNCIGNYLVSYWNLENHYIYNIIQIVMTFIILLVTVVTNTAIPQYIFIPFVLISSLISLLCSTCDRIQHSKFRTADRKLKNEKSILKNDILRVVPIISQDQEYRLNRFTLLSKNHFETKKDLITKDFTTNIISTVVQIVFSCFLILTYVYSSGKIDLSTVAGMTATLVVYNTAITYFEKILKIITESSQNWDVLEKEISMMENILNIYNLQKGEKAESINSLEISPFEIAYAETSENDKSFRLILDQNLSFEKGDCVSLTGASGSGKSTFLKVTTKRIRFKKVKQSKITPVNYVYYDESIDFGSMPLWDELFCLDGKTRIKPSPEELAKMEYILKEMKLYQEISEQCQNFWTWLQENTANSLSKGQKQRLIVSKILFWLSPDIDIVALDECTSGLDAEADDDNNADALKILQFIIAYCNRDKKRFLFLATHQDIENLCNHRLHFKRTSGKTIIKKIR